MTRRGLVVLVVALAVVHAAFVARHWSASRGLRHGNDFASYHYAWQVAAAGGDPYDVRALSEAARAERTRTAVHPFFYPPPFLLGMAWTGPLDLQTAYRVWFWLDEAFGVLAAVLLWRWWRPLGRWTGVVVALAVATWTAIPNNHVMGQFNLPVLAIVVGGSWASEARRPVLGGVLLGLACMLKMSPALFVAWWLLRRRWTEVAVACATAVLLSVAALPVVGAEVQLRFYTEVLPGFATGDYNGLRVPIDLFGNHSIPDVLHRAFPSQDGLLSPTASRISSLCTVLLLAGLAVAFRRPPADRLALAAQIGAIGVVLLLIPVYTYEHHLVWALPAAVALAMAVVTGAVPRWWAVPVVFAWALTAFDLFALKAVWRQLGDSLPGTVVREAKFVALLVLLALTARLGSGPRATG